MRYDAELLEYLQRNGLQPSDLIKPRGKKKEAKEKSQAPSRKSSQQQQQKHEGVAAIDPTFTTQDQTPAQAEGNNFLDLPGSVGVMTGGLAGGYDRQAEVSYEDPSGRGMLPPFSQVWSGQDMSPDQLGQMMCAGGGVKEEPLTSDEDRRRHGVQYRYLAQKSIVTRGLSVHTYRQCLGFQKKC